jgi:hypothetical protein
MLHARIAEQIQIDIVDVMTWSSIPYEDRSSRLTSIILYFSHITLVSLFFISFNIDTDEVWKYDVVPLLSIPSLCMQNTNSFFFQ